MAMASSSSLPKLLSLILLTIAAACGGVSAANQPSFRPKALVLPITKDPTTFQYLTHIKQRTPLIDVPLVIDLGGQFLWVDCDKGYVSSSYTAVRCGSARCSLSKSKSCGYCFAGPIPGCNNNTCGLFPYNSVKPLTTVGELTEDVLSIRSTDGSNPGRAVSLPKFLFTCGSTFLLDGLAKGAKTECSRRGIWQYLDAAGGEGERELSGQEGESEKFTSSEIFTRVPSIQPKSDAWTHLAADCTPAAPLRSSCSVDCTPIQLELVVTANQSSIRPAARTRRHRPTDPIDANCCLLPIDPCRATSSSDCSRTTATQASAKHRAARVPVSSLLGGSGNGRKRPSLAAPETAENGRPILSRFSAENGRLINPN